MNKTILTRTRCPGEKNKTSFIKKEEKHILVRKKRHARKEEEKHILVRKKRHARKEREKRILVRKKIHARKEREKHILVRKKRHAQKEREKHIGKGKRKRKTGTLTDFVPLSINHKRPDKLTRHRRLKQAQTTPNTSRTHSSWAGKRRARAAASRRPSGWRPAPGRWPGRR